MKQWQIHEGLSAPASVTWEITRQCNLSCIHCLSDSGRDRGNELPYDQCLNVIDQLSRSSVFQVNFGGGEPLLREDFLSMLDACHEKDLVTCISTNGTCLHDEVLRFFKGRGLVYLQVSLDGANPSTNDLIRGRGTFDRIIKALDRLSAWEIPYSVNTVLTRLNFPELPRLHDLARERGAKLRVSRYRPAGRGKETWERLHLRKEELAAFSRWLSEHTDVVTGDSFFSLEEKDRRGLGLNLCGAAKFTCCIDPAGDVFPCAFLQDPSFYAGTLPGRSLRQIWSRSFSFRLLRSLRIRSCESCFRFESCYGGCPAVAFFTRKTLDAPDPECLVHCVERAS